MQLQLGAQVNELTANITKLEKRLLESQEETRSVQASADEELANAKDRLTQSIDTSHALKEQIRKLTEALIKVTRERDEALKRVQAYEDANQRGLQAYEKVKVEKEGAAKLLQELSTQNHVLQEDVMPAPPTLFPELPTSVLMYSKWRVMILAGRLFAVFYLGCRACRFRLPLHCGFQTMQFMPSSS